MPERTGCWAAVVWRNDGFEAALVDEHGALVDRMTFDRSGPEAIADRVQAWSRDRSESLTCVFESSNGMIDGHLLARGIEAWRVEYDALPNPQHDALVLAKLVSFGLLRALPTSLSSGTLGDRSAELKATNESARGIQDDLERAGRLLQRGRALDLEHPRIALTFDDGPSADHTDAIMDVLEAYQAPATFFCVGLNVLAYPHIIRRMHDRGYGIGNHTWSHAYLPELRVAEVRQQLHRTNQALFDVTGSIPAMARPPYGGRDAVVLNTIAGEGMTTVLWDVEAADWILPGSEAIVGSVLSAAGDGSVVLLHDGGGDRGQTVAALPAILDGLLRGGFRFVDLSDLMHDHAVAGSSAGPELQKGGRER
ncbi:polysaccharide deacetylase family protein [Actinoplanes sp. NPDC051475]|uniref:polysaccharide deacetylase family protein n=1 Tax=Actinoplanes sp. NPDC051475 TaxID=3157225 RepID=UPI00344E7711